MFFVAKSSKKYFFFRGDFRPLLSITFPQRFQISKNIGHPTSGSGGKKTVKRYLKSEQTDKQTDKQTNIWTNRLIESIGPEGRCFENILNVYQHIESKYGLHSFARIF